MSKNTNKPFSNFIIAIIILIALILIFFYFKADKNEDEEQQRLKRIKELESEKKILINHLQKNIDLELKIRETSERLWRRSLRIILISFLLFNFIYYLIFNGFTIKVETLKNLSTFYTYSSIIIGALYLAISIKWFSMKDFIFENLKEFSFKIVAKNRNALYFTTKRNNIQNRIEQINLELNQLNIDTKNNKN